jgi:hypothetical protein
LAKNHSSPIAAHGLSGTTRSYKGRIGRALSRSSSKNRSISSAELVMGCLSAIHVTSSLQGAVVQALAIDLLLAWAVKLGLLELILLTTHCDETRGIIMVDETENATYQKYQLQRSDSPIVGLIRVIFIADVLPASM